MKFLVLTPGVFDKGGISRYGRFQIKALRDYYGIDSVRVLSLLGPDKESLEEEFSVDWYGSPVPTLISRVKFSYQAFRYAISDKPNIVLTGHLNIGPLGRLCSYLSGGLLVQYIYGREVWSGFSKARKKALIKADALIADCHNTADYVVHADLRKEKPFVVWDCVDTDRYTPGEPNKEVLEQYGLTRSNRFRLMFLGRLHKSVRYKGTERMLHLLADLPIEFEGVIAGGGDDVGYLRELAIKLGIADRIYFPGRIHEDHMPDVYRSADVFYLVSEAGQGMGEGLPLTPIEAMACGVPVIVGNQDGSREILDESGGGICVSPIDSGYIVGYLKILESDRLYNQLERNSARLRSIAVFSYTHFAKNTIGAIRSLLSGIAN